MAGGSLTLTFDTYEQFSNGAQRVLCWASTPTKQGLITTNSGTNVLSLVVPEAAFGAGSLVLKRAGTDLVSGYVAGTHIVANVGNGSAMQQDPNTCPVSTNQPTVTSFTTNVGGVPLATSLVYANVALSGTVDIAWGDGTSTLAAAEAGTEAHTYALSGFYTITISDVSVPTDTGSLTVRVP
jgi:hypothetical protein